MPSTITPTSLRIGPGQLSDNVGSAASLVAALPSTGAPLGVDPKATIMLVSSNEDLVLARHSSRIIVVAENMTGPCGVTFPEEARAGDSITVLISTEGTNLVFASVPSGSSLNGVVDGGELLSGFNDSRTYLNISADGPPSWMRIAEKTTIRTDVSALESIPEQFVLVDPSGGPRTVQMPATPTVGDRVTVINISSSVANGITIDRNSGTNTIDGVTAIEFRQPLASITLVCVSATEWITLTRSGSHVVETSVNVTLPVKRETCVLASSGSGALTITLPESGLIGDVVTVIDSEGAASTNAIQVTASTGSDNIMGVAGSWSINDNFGSITLFRASSTVWAVRQKSTPFLVSVNNTTSFSARRGPEMRVLVDTSSGSWTGTGPQDTITTPLLPSTGDRFTVCDVGGQADVKHITIVGDGTRVIGETPAAGPSQTRIAKRFGTLTLLFTGSRWVEESTSNINPFVAVSNTIALERYGRDFTVHVDTAAGSWSSADTITLPSTSTSAMVGDTVTVVDVGGLAGATNDIITVAASSGTINGLSSFVIGTNFGSTTFVYVGGNNWVTASSGEQAVPVITLSSAGAVVRLARSTLVLVDTAAGTWDDTDIVTLPAAAAMRVGDEVTVSDAGGQAAGLGKGGIRVVPASGTINGTPSYTVLENFGHAAFRHVGSGNWIVTSASRLWQTLDPLLLRLRQVGIDTPFADNGAAMAVTRMSNGRLIAIKAGATDTRTVSEADDSYVVGGTVASITSLVTGVAINGSRIVAVGTGGNRCCFSTDFGATWSAGSDLGATPNLGGIIYNSTHSRFMVAFAAGVSVAQDVDGASTWASVSTGLTSAQGGIAHFSNGDTLACGLDGSADVAMARSTDGGASWSATATVPNPGDYDNSGWIHGDGGNTIYHVGAVGGGATLRVSATTSVMSWSLRASFSAIGGISFKPRIFLCPDTGVLVVIAPIGSGTTVYLSRDRGFTWHGPEFYRSRFTSSFGIARGRLFSSFGTSLFATDRLL